MAQYYHREALKRNLSSKIEKDLRKHAQLWGEADELADQYDATVDRLQTVIESALVDVNRRLLEIAWWKQVNRRVGQLPHGRNPKPLSDPLAKFHLEAGDDAAEDDAE